MNVTNLKERVDEMIKLNNTMTKYTETYVRPSLSDMYVFDTIVCLINDSNEDPENSDYIFKSDISAVWEHILKHDLVFSLEYGPEQLYEEILDYLVEHDHALLKEDLEEIEDEDDSDE